MAVVKVHDKRFAYAPLERMWRLSTRVELVSETLGMDAVDGVTQGFVQEGSRVVWRGWKFGLPTEHHTLITGFAPPHLAGSADDLADRNAEFAGQPVAWFQDSQEQGRFAFFQHNHWLRERTLPGGQLFTELEDEVHFGLPFGLAGELVARMVMVPYVKRLVRRRFARLRRLAEGDGWRDWA